MTLTYLYDFIVNTIKDPIRHENEQDSSLALMRKIAILWLPFNLSFFVVFLLCGLYISALGMLFISINHFLCIYLSTKGFNKLPRILETIVPSLSIFTLACFEFPVTNTIKLMIIILNLSLVSFSFIFFSIKEWKYMAIGVSLIIVYGLLYEFLGPYFYRGNKNILTDSFLFESSIYIMSLMMLCVCFIFFKKMIENQIEVIRQLLNESNIQKELIQQQKYRVTSQKEEIETQRDEIIKQRDFVIKQKEQIEQSIIYAKQIQNAILPSQDLLKEYFSDNFIYYKPKDIVSGDFYWIANIGSKKIIIAADCTGHGVPGAFMSVLGITLLNDIVRVERELNPDAILHNLRERIIKLFDKTDGEYIQKDGMDVTISIINTKDHTLEFAGANNKIYIISGEDLHEIEGDKMPVGFSYSNDPFTSKSFKFKKGDSIYMFSDGYRDQFGGPNSKRFQSKRFKEVLKLNNAKNMNEIETAIHTTYEKWKGYNEQVDDVLVMGFRI